MTGPEDGAEPGAPDRQLDGLLRVRDREGGAVGHCHAGAPGRVFGGQLAAQAVAAAAIGLGVDRVLHSVHARFLAPALPDQPIEYDVHDLHVGRSFAVREVRARQAGNAVLTATCSAHRAGTAPAAEAEPPALPLPPLPAPDADADGSDPVHEIQRVLRVVPEPTDAEPGVHRSWLAARDDSPTTPAAWPAMLAYLADAVLLPAVVGRAGADLETTPASSLDLLLWIHRPAPLRPGWLFAEATCGLYRDGRGLANLELRTPDGRLVASAAQEVLVRETGTRSVPATGQEPRTKPS